LATFLPPVLTLTRRYEWAEILRYSLWAVVVPSLFVLGAPWKSFPRAAMLAADRSRHPDSPRTFGVMFLYALVVIFWFTPASVRAAWGNSWLGLIEALTLITAGTLLWLELVTSPPLVPRSGHLRRVVLGALVMWLLWIEAYLVGMSQSGWYGFYLHTAPQTMSQAADQQVAAIVLWLVATAAFVPCIFRNALSWLQSEQDPDSDLRRLVKEDRRGASALIARREEESRSVSSDPLG